MKSSRHPPSSSQEGSGVLKEERRKLTLVDLKTVVQSIQKRLRTQALSRLILHSGSHQMKKSKLKIATFLLQSFLRRKIRSAFQSVARNKARRRMVERAGYNLLLKCRRLHRNCLQNCLIKLIFFKHNSKPQFSKATAKLPVAPLISPRLSECSDRSNILSVSEDSLSEKEEGYVDRRHYRHSDPIVRGGEGEDIRMMALSSEVKESLLKLQKYNRLTYQSQSQKILKEAVAAEMKRLEALKSKEMRNKLSDNELTITCLHNHICLLSANSEDLANNKDSEQRNQIQQRLMMSNKAEHSFPSKKHQSSFTQEEVTALNILSTALRARKFKDIKREADYLVKKTQKQQLLQLIKELSSFISEGESIEEGGREREKEKIETTNLINLFDKHLRTDKIQQLQALRNKSMEHPYLQELSNLFETVIITASQLKKLKRKDSSSGEKFKSLQKDKLKRVLEKENQQLKRELKNIQNKNNELSLELDRLKDNFKKVDRVHPSLLPKRSLEKELPPAESKQEVLLKRTKGSQSALLKTEVVDRQKDKELQEKWEMRIKDLQQQVECLKTKEVFLRGVANELQDFKKYYSVLKGKAQKKEPFAREINQYKRLHKESLFLEILQDFAAFKSFKNQLLTQLGTVHTVFNDGSWKRRYNSLVVKNENEDSQSLNKIIDTLVTLSKTKEEQASAIRDLESVKKRQASQIAENMGLKEEIVGLRNEIKEQRQEISRMTEQSSRIGQSENARKTKTPEKIQRSSMDKQMTDLKTQNERLKRQLEVNQKQVKLEKGELGNDRSIVKEWEQASKCCQLVLKKRQEDQSYQIHVNNFKRNYSQSVFLQFFELLSAIDSEKVRVVSTLKSIANAFEEGLWKQKQLNLFLKGDDELFLTINRIAELLLDSYRQQEENQSNLKELQALRNKTISLAQTSEDLRVQLREKNSALSRERQKQREKPLSERQIVSFQTTIESLKHSLQEKETRIFQLNSSMTVSTPRMNELQEVYNLLDRISEKRKLGQSYQPETRNFKTKYPQSSINKLLETMMKQDEEISFLTSHLKSLNTMLSNGTQRPKALPSDRDRAYYIQLSKLTDLIGTVQKEKEEAQSKASSFEAEIRTAQQQMEQQKGQLSRIMATMNEPSHIKKSNTEIDLSLSRDINDLKLANDRLLTDKNTLREELQNAIKSNAISNADIEKLHGKVFLLEKEVKQLRETETMERSRDNERRKLENRVQELQGHLSFMEEKIHNYEMLFQRYKEEKDNLVLMIQEKEEEYQLSRENEEMHIKEKQERDEKILELKQRYEETQLSIKEIQREVDRLMAEKQTQDIQRRSAEELLQIQLSEKEVQLASLRERLELSEKSCYKLGSQVEMGEVRLRNELAMKDSEKQFFKKEVELHQLELAQLKQRSHEERKELKEQYGQLNRELSEERKLREEERVLLKNYLAAEGQPRSHSVGEDFEKKELRKQLELANQELAAMVRSSEGEKRQIRQMVDSLAGQLQLQSAVFNEEKKVLKEGIERARNQEYEIHSQKMRKLREDIQALREQNQRLICIIDSNEQAFNELIAEHRDLSLRNSSLVQENSNLADQQARLESQLIKSTHQNEDLTHQLRLLQDKLGVIENEVFSAMEEGQVHSQQLIGSRTRQEELEGTVNSLTHQRQLLQARLVQESRKTLSLQQRIQELEGGPHPIKEGGDYSRYLQDKLSTQEGEMKRYLQNQKNLIAKIQQLMTTVSTLEREKMQYRSTRRDKEIQLIAQKNAGQKDILVLQQKINKLEETLSNQERELLQDRKGSSHPALDPRLQHLQEHNRALQADIEKLKTAGESLKRQKIALQGKVQINSKAVVEAKLISNKYADLEAECKELEGKLAAMQIEDSRKQKGKDEKDSPSLNSLDLQLMAQRTLTLKKEEEITWLQTQLSFRETQIHKLRSTELRLSQELRKTQEALQLKDHWQNQFEKEVLGHEETRRQSRTQEEFYLGELQRARLHEKEATQSFLLSKQNLRVLNQSYQQLLGQQNQLKEEAQQRRGESEVLKQIVLQLDSEFPLSGDDEHLELQILQKISFEVEDLLTSNQKLRNKCDSLEISIFQGSTEVSEQSLLFSLHAMAENLLTLLQEQQLLSSGQAETNLRQLLLDSNRSAQGYICNLQVFLQTLVTSVAKQNHQSCVEARLQLDNARRVLEESRTSSPPEVLTRLRELLR